MPGVALLAYGLRFVQPHDTAPAILHAAAVDGVLSSLTPLAIVFGAVLLFKTMEKSGAMGVLAARRRELTPDPIAQLMLVGWAFSFLIEGLSGFGTPAALAAPILAGLGFPALRVAAMCLIMNSVPVSFGAVGTPTWFGLGGVDLAAGELGEIGWRTALVHAAAAPFIAILALRVVAPWAQIRRRLAFVLMVVATSVGPYVLAARFNVQFPSIVGRLAGLIGAAVLVRWRVGLPLATEPSAMPAAAGVATTSPHAQAPMSLARAIMPLAATVLLLAVTRIDAMGLKALLKSDAGAASATIPGVGQAWISPAMVVGLRDIFGTDANWRIPLLFVPFILPFVVVALAAIPVLRMNLAAVRSAWAETFTRLVRPAIALAGALGLDRATVLALQSAGGAMGNMVCIHNIVAVGAVLGLSETRDAGRGPGAVASVLRLTIGPLVAYALIAAAMAGVLSIVHS